jgi:hypothetical protein
MVRASVVDEIRYPVGEFRIDPDVTPEKRKMWIEQLAEAPAKLRTALLGLSEEQMDTRYRKDGWTLRQVVHHLADAQLNGFTRFKLALTEDRPAIKTYEEDLWSETVDGREAPANCQSICSPHCMRGGSFFLSRSLKVALRAPSAILNGVSCELMTPYSCMLGTAFTTPHTSANCASAMAGKRRHGAVQSPSHIGQEPGNLADCKYLISDMFRGFMMWIRWPLGTDPRQQDPEAASG